MKLNYQANAVEKAAEMEEAEDESESDEGPDEDDDQIPREEGKSSGEENEVIIHNLVFRQIIGY